MTVLTSSKQLGVRGSALIPGSAAALAAAEGDVADQDAILAADVNSNKKSTKMAALQKRRELDEGVCGLFIHKSSLSYRSKADSATVFDDNEDGEGVGSDGEGANEEDEEEEVVMDDENKPINPSLIESRYKIRSIIPKVRVMGYNLVEGIYVASNLPSATRSQGDIVHWSQLSVGQVVPVTVTAVKESGIMVMINGKVKALCPRMHTADVVTTSINDASTMKLLLQKFKIGQLMKMRVWEIKQNSIILTNKKTLVNDRSMVRDLTSEIDMKTSTIISSFDSAYERWSGYGVITDVSEKTGLRIHFYNRVKGTVPIRILMKQGIFSVSESYRVGQVVRCIVIRKFNAREADVTGNKSEYKTLLLALEIGSVKDVMSSLASEMKAIQAKDIAGQQDDDNDDEEEDVTDAVTTSATGTMVSATSNDPLFVAGSLLLRMIGMSFVLSLILYICCFLLQFNLFCGSFLLYLFSIRYHYWHKREIYVPSS